MSRVREGGLTKEVKRVNMLNELPMQERIQNF
jgi:hypothetical protein